MPSTVKLSGRPPELESGNVSPEQITISDLTGTGVQDTAIAPFARRRALALGLGREFGGQERAT